MVQYQLPKLTQTIKIVLIIHGAFFIVSIFAPQINAYFALFFQPTISAHITLIFRIFTYTLISSNNIMSLLMFGLFMWWVGGRLEEIWGRDYFIFFYLVTVGVSGILCLVIFHFTGIPAIIAGTTGVTFAIIAVFAYLTPNSPFYVFGIFPLKVKWLLAISLILTFMEPSPIGILYNILFQVITGLVAVCFVMINFPLPMWISPYLGKVKHRIEKMKRDYSYKRKKKTFTLYKHPESESSSSDMDNVSEETYNWAREEVDKLLDKIKKEGIDSLSDKEKKFLDKNSKDYDSSDYE